MSMTCCRRFLIGLVGTSRSQRAYLIRGQREARWTLSRFLDAEYAYRLIQTHSGLQ